VVAVVEHVCPVGWTFAAPSAASGSVGLIIVRICGLPDSVAQPSVKAA
jgi:hypothetical protein